MPCVKIILTYTGDDNKNRHRYLTPEGLSTETMGIIGTSGIEQPPMEKLRCSTSQDLEVFVSLTSGEDFDAGGRGQAFRFYLNTETWCPPELKSYFPNVTDWDTELDRLSQAGQLLLSGQIYNRALTEMFMSTVDVPAEEVVASKFTTFINLTYTGPDGKNRHRTLTDGVFGEETLGVTGANGQIHEPFALIRCKDIHQLEVLVSVSMDRGNAAKPYKSFMFNVNTEDTVWHEAMLDMTIKDRGPALCMICDKVITTLHEELEQEFG